MTNKGLSPDDSIDLGEWYDDLTYKEVHLFVEGFYRGFVGLDPRWGKKLQGRVIGDSWYAKGGFVLGKMGQLLLAGGGFEVATGIPVLPF